MSKKKKTTMNIYQKKISIIIPVYKQVANLSIVLSNISQQTVKERIEDVIIVDDGNKKPITKADFVIPVNLEQKLKIINLNKNFGAAQARNIGFKHSQGDYIIFWDADIIGQKNFLELFCQVLDNEPNISFVYSSFYYGLKKMPAKDFSYLELKKNNYIHTTSLIRRQDFLGFDKKLKRFQDWDLWLTMAENNKRGYFINKFLFKIYKTGLMSFWLPSFAYKKPWSWLFKKRVDDYNQARLIVLKKHQINDCA